MEIGGNFNQTYKILPAYAYRAEGWEADDVIGVLNSSGQIRYQLENQLLKQFQGVVWYDLTYRLQNKLHIKFWSNFWNQCWDQLQKHLKSVTKRTDV